MCIRDRKGYGKASAVLSEHFLNKAGGVDKGRGKRYFIGRKKHTYILIINRRNAQTGSLSLCAGRVVAVSYTHLLKRSLKFLIPLIMLFCIPRRNRRFKAASPGKNYSNLFVQKVQHFICNGKNLNSAV